VIAVLNKMMVGALVLLCSSWRIQAQPANELLFPVRGFAIGAPATKDVDRFVKFIGDELVPRNVNVLVLRVDFNYRYTSHPELQDSDALSRDDVRKIVDVCSHNHIRIIPQINLLGHQSWASKVNNLLAKYPEFDETPNVKMPVKYEWPNADGLYCKSYCPLHPQVHAIVFALVDELCDAFQATAFHAGMDEVFYLGDDDCPRCGGRDKAGLFAGEVRRISDHLAIRNRELWIWGDRLLDGKTTGLGMWEASFNQTSRAIDLIPNDVVICDWHYERPDPTAVMFAMKGLRVITCPWNRPEVAVVQAEDMARMRMQATPEMKNRFYGVMQTVWSGAGNFIDGFYGTSVSKGTQTEGNTAWETFRKLYQRMDELEKSVAKQK
jgi:Glycosyl hydrolase family 20, catalytic domain